MSICIKTEKVRDWAFAPTDSSNQNGGHSASISLESMDGNRARYKNLYPSIVNALDCPSRTVSTLPYVPVYNFKTMEQRILEENLGIESLPSLIEEYIIPFNGNSAYFKTENGWQLLKDTTISKHFNSKYWDDIKMTFAKDIAHSASFNSGKSSESSKETSDEKSTDLLKEVIETIKKEVDTRLSTIHEFTSTKKGFKVLQEPGLTLFHRPDLLINGQPNLWPSMKITNEKDGYCGTILKVISQWFQTLKEAQFFLDWLALKVQNPSQKQLGLIFLSDQGAGKNTIARLLNELYGGQAKINLTDKELKSPNNSYLSQVLLACFNELNIKGSDSDTIYNNIKSMLTDSELMVREKYEVTVETDSYASFMFFSNHSIPFKLEQNDTRIVCFRIPSLQKGKAIPHLEEVLKDEVPAFRWFLLNRKILSADNSRSGQKRLMTAEMERLLADSQDSYQMWASTLKVNTLIHGAEDAFQVFQKWALGNALTERAMENITQTSFNKKVKLSDTKHWKRTTVKGKNAYKLIKKYYDHD